MSLDKTLLTLTALRDGLKIFWKPAAFWITKDWIIKKSICDTDLPKLDLFRPV